MTNFHDKMSLQIVKNVSTNCHDKFSRQNVTTNCHNKLLHQIRNVDDQFH